MSDSEPPRERSYGSHGSKEPQNTRYSEPEQTDSPLPKRFGRGEFISFAVHATLKSRILTAVGAQPYNAR